MKILGLIMILILVSCNGKQKRLFEEYNGLKFTESISESLKGNISYTLDLPDTMRVDKPYEAVFEFDSPFDKIVNPMEDTITFRTIKLSYFEPLKLESKILKSDVILKDSVYIPNKKFILSNVKFKEKGKYLFVVLIEDQIMYNYYSKSKRDSIHFDRLFEEIKKEVVIVE